MVRVAGHVFVVDLFANAIRRVDLATGDVKTIAGELGVRGKSDGTGAAAHFAFFDPAGASGGVGSGITTDGTNLYVSDGANFAIRKVVIATGEVTTLAGGTKGTANGTGAAAQFVLPAGLAYADGFLYVADSADNTIRRAGQRGQLGFSPGPLPATMNCPSSLTVAPNGDLFFADGCDRSIGVISPL